MDHAVLVIAFVTALFGSALATWTGFGAATILTPVLVMFIDTRQAIFVVAIFHGIHNIVKTVTFRRTVVLRIVLLFGLGAVALAPVGGRHPDLLRFRGSIPCLYVPLSTSRLRPYGRLRMTRGQCGWLFLHCRTLSFPTHNRFKLVAHSTLKTPRAGAQTNLSTSRDIKGASPWLD